MPLVSPLVWARAASTNSQLFVDATLPVFLFSNTQWLSVLLSVLVNVLTPSQHERPAPLQLISTPISCFSFVFDRMRKCQLNSLV